MFLIIVNQVLILIKIIINLSLKVLIILIVIQVIIQTFQVQEMLLITIKTYKTNKLAQLLI